LAVSVDLLDKVDLGILTLRLPIYHLIAVVFSVARWHIFSLIFNFLLVDWRLLKNVMIAGLLLLKLL
jgi:hypothetical protein